MAQISITGMKAGADKLRALTNMTTARRTTFRSWAIAWRQAARAFVSIAVRNALIETGMTAASFFPLARAVGRVESVVKAKVAQRGKLKKGVPELPSGARSSGIQGPRAGAIRGKKGFVFTTGNETSFRFRFSFQTTVFQHAFHEATGKSTTLQPGINAFVTEIMVRFPEIARDILEDFFQGKAIKLRKTKKSYYSGPTQQVNIGGL